jgi:equilibrative nucleoside transporter 1/2/3
LELEHHKEEVNEVCDETHRIMLMEPLLGKESIIGGNEEENKPPDIWNVIQIPTICVFLIFFITLTIFPSWTTKLESTRQCQERSNRFSNDLFVQFLIVAFNVADLLGRLASRAFKIDEGSKTFSRNLSLASVARLIFFPLFLFCKVSGGALAPTFKIFFNDIYPVSFVIIFAFTNGLLSTLAFMRISQLTPAIDDMQRYVSTIINFTVGFGLLCGSLFSFVFNLIGSGHW